MESIEYFVIKIAKANVMNKRARGTFFFLFFLPFFFFSFYAERNFSRARNSGEKLTGSTVRSLSEIVLKNSLPNAVASCAAS